jgi:hypothetical protein
MVGFKRTLLSGAVAGLALLAFGAGGQAAEGPIKEVWPAAVSAHYKLKFNGISVGKIAFSSKAAGKTYELTSNGEVSLLFGAIKWTGASNVAGAIEAVEPAPKSYAFDWKRNKKGGAIKLGFAGHKAVEVAVEPPPSAHHDTVPLSDKDKQGVVDPLSAIMALTTAAKGDPCERRVKVFDGKQRFDIVFSPKRQTVIPAPKGGASAVGYVCRAMYEPIAGHRANADQKAYAANRDAEVVLRKLPGSEALIPHSVTIPTAWGTGTMVIERVDVTSATAGQFAVTE